MLSVRDGGPADGLFQAAFGAKVLFQLEDNGSVVAQLSVEGAEFWLLDECPASSNFSPETLGGGTVRMAMIVEDPDAVFDRAVKVGAKVVRPVDDQPYGWRVGRVVDPFGTTGKSGNLLHQRESWRR
jgi:PhnB protein